MQNNKKSLSVCTLSGTSGIGRNCSFIEYNDKIVIVDFGFEFPEEQMYGIDYLIPNYAYLKRNKNKIQAILITHGHLDHTGGLAYVLKELGFPPIYAGTFANSLIRERLKDFGLEKSVKFENVQRNTIKSFGEMRIKFIGVTHSIPNAFSIFIDTPNGNVFFSGDYKIDTEPENEPETDYKSLELLQGKVDLAMMESTNSEEEGKTISAKKVGTTLDAIVKNANGRVIVTAFASLVSRLYSLIQIAKKYNKKVFVSGRSLNTSLRIAKNLGYVNIPKDLLQPESKLSQYSDKQVLILCTGSQGERYSALNRISLREHKYIKIKKNDLVIMSSSDIPGNILQIENMTDRLITEGADLVKSNMMEVYESGHGMKIDMKMMYDLIQPKFVIPIHGSMTKRYLNEKNFVEWGMSKDRIFLTQDGQFWNRVPNGWTKGKRIDAKPILIDGLGVGDIGEIVLKDREQLANYGMVCIIMNLHNKTLQLIGKIRFESRGFVYMKASKQLMKNLENLARDTHKKWWEKGKGNKPLSLSELRENLVRDLGKYIYKTIEREPMILPVFV
ncbi:MAG: ribonuclease J [Patescibacteria group bacterium]|nr:ribonuclease J [Patescibacteria group bacterium]